MKETLDYIWNWLTDAYNFLGGVLMAILGYFLPIKYVVHFLIFLFVVDALLGYLKSRKLNNERFDVGKIWNTTIPRMALSVLIISLLFIWDSVYKQDYIASYNIAGWFFSGLLIVSISDNAGKITGWKVFGFISLFLRKRIDDKAELNNENLEEDEKSY